MTAELRIAAPVWDALRAHHLAAGKTVESLSYIWANVEADGSKILVPHTAPLLRFAPDCFERQAGGQVRLHADVLRGMLINFAGSYLNGLINVHDHWFDRRTVFSGIDDADDIAFGRYLHGRYQPALGRLEGAVPRALWNIALVLGQEGADARLIETRRGRCSFLPLRRITVIGAPYRTIPLGPAPDQPSEVSSCFARHKDFVDPQAQASLRGLHGALVGCGGTGSILAEALGRVGVGAITLVDDDTLDETSLNRWQGGEPCMVGQKKVAQLAYRLRRMFPDTQVHTLPGSIFDPALEPHLRAADVIFGCVDHDTPRYFLNRLALQQLTPYFDLGVVVHREEDGSVDFRTRYFAVLPGTTACLGCSAFQLYDRMQTEAAFLDAATAREWRRAGYVSGTPAPAAPSVYALNQRAVGLAITEFLNWICGWRPIATVITESWARGTMERADRSNFPEAPDPECPLCGYYAGAGSREPLPRPPAFPPSRRGNPPRRNLRQKEQAYGRTQARAC